MACASSTGRSVRRVPARTGPPTSLDEVPLTPGTHDIRVRFSVADEPADGAPVPPLHIRERVDVRPGRVVLVARDADTGALVVR